MNSLLKKKKKTWKHVSAGKKKQSLYLDEKFVPFFIYKKKREKQQTFWKRIQNLCLNEKFILFLLKKFPR